MIDRATQPPIPSPLYVTFSVWKALILREAITRISGKRATWVWLLLEPIIHLMLMMFIFSVIRVRVVSGMHVAIWLLYGLLAMFMFMRTATQSKNAISSNKALFAYRQVKPVDTVLTRAFLEAFITLIITILMFGLTFLIGIGVFPYDPLLFLAAFLGLWVTGLGYGLITSVVIDLIPELDIVLKLAMGPIYMISGVVFPIDNIPDPYRKWLLLNPIAHSIEAVRSSISPFYHAFAELSIAYIFGVASISIIIGLALHKRFATQLVMK